MPIPPIPPAGLGPEFQIQPIERPGAPTEGAEAPGKGGFGSMLSEQLGKLQETQNEANAQSQALATGKAEDVTSVVMAVERAALSLQLAAQVRNKAVEAYQDIFRMHI